jgi:hypothetical protein
MIIYVLKKNNTFLVYKRQEYLMLRRRTVSSW